VSKITRAVQKIFGSSAGVNQIAKFGSLAASASAYTTDPATIQSLSQYLTGWFGAVIGGNSPAIEDWNALCYLYAYQIAYGFQAGIPEWETNTIYYIGSFVSDSLGGIYYSLTDANTGNAITSVANWRRFNLVSSVAIDPATQTPYVLGATDNTKTFKVNSAAGVQQFTLPAAASSTNYIFTVKDTGGYSSVNNITIVRAASETIEGFAGTYTCRCDYGDWTFICDGTNWLLK